MLRRRRGLGGFARCAEGVSALEFCLVAPFLVLLLLGVSDFAPSIVARFKASHADNAFGDIVAQSSALQPSDLVADYAAAADVLAPFDSSSLKLRVTSVYSDGNGHAYVHWSCGPTSLPPLAARSAVTTTPTGKPVSGLLYLNNGSSGGYTQNGANTSYIMTESTYVYTAPAQFVLRSSQTMKNVDYLYPRQSAFIGFPWDGNANNPPPKPTDTTKSSSVTLSNGVACNYESA